MSKKEFLKAIDKAIDKGLHIEIKADNRGNIVLIKIEYKMLWNLRENIEKKFTEALEHIKLGYKILDYKYVKQVI